MFIYKAPPTGGAIDARQLFKILQFTPILNHDHVLPALNTGVEMINNSMQLKSDYSIRLFHDRVRYYYS